MDKDNERQLGIAKISHQQTEMDKKNWTA